MSTHPIRFVVLALGMLVAPHEAVAQAHTRVPIVGVLSIVNLKTARSLGVAIPQSILLRADEVIR